MTELQTLAPPECAVVVDTLEAVIDARLVALQWDYEQRWHDADLSPVVSDWLREVLTRATRDMRGELLRAVHDIVSSRVRADGRPMTDERVRMRVLQRGTNDTGTHEVGDEIVVDAVHAAMFEIAGFAVPVATVTEAADPAADRRRRLRGH